MAEQVIRVGSKMIPDNPLFISREILDKAFENPDGTLTPLGKFVFYSKYSRWRSDMRRREYWSETSQRSVEYNVNLAIAHLEEKGLLTQELIDLHQKEADDLFTNQFGLKQALSGRTLWVGGTQASYLNPMGNFNCSFIVLDEWKKLGELIHLGMVGTGIGFRTLYADIDKLDKIKNRHWDIQHEEYNGKPAGSRDEHSTLVTIESRAYLTIGDSKEGWREAIDLFTDMIIGKHGKVHRLIINYDNVRPAGERLKRFGGRAGGPETIKAMFDKFHQILTGSLIENYPRVTPAGRVKPIHLLDLANAIGKNIISGGVRSIAEIGLVDPDDQESVNAKLNIFDKKQLNHRFVSNNSVYYQERPTDDQFDWQFYAIENNGEPCFVNAVVAKRRRKNFNGVNPCVEILLDDRGLCNLVTVNMVAFVVDGVLDVPALLEAFRLATRAALRMTLPKLELPEWDIIQQRDRLLGVSMTGYQDMIDAIDKGTDRNFEIYLLETLKKTVRGEANSYAEMLGVNAPELTTCVKPEGTQSQMFGGVSSGLHVSHAPNFLRRVRSAAKDPISRAVFDLGWRMSAEFQDGSQHDEIADILQYMPFAFDAESLQPKWYQHHSGRLRVKFQLDVEHTSGIEDRAVKMFNAYYDGNIEQFKMYKHAEKDTTVFEYVVNNPSYDQIFGKSTKVVIDFPQESPAKRTKATFSAIEQLEVYKMFLNHYAEHNPSNTISVRPEEWKGVKQWVKDNWDDMLAVSFLTLYDAPYPLLPYEETTKEEIDSLRASMADFDPMVLVRYDQGEDTELVEAGCEGMACPVR